MLGGEERGLGGGRKGLLQRGYQPYPPHKRSNKDNSDRIHFQQFFTLSASHQTRQRWLAGDCALCYSWVSILFTQPCPNAYWSAGCYVFTEVPEVQKGTDISGVGGKLRMSEEFKASLIQGMPKIMVRLSNIQESLKGTPSIVVTKQSRVHYVVTEVSLTERERPWPGQRATDKGMDV